MLTLCGLLGMAASAWSAEKLMARTGADRRCQLSQKWEVRDDAEGREIVGCNIRTTWSIAAGLSFFLVESVDPGRQTIRSTITEKAMSRSTV